MPVVLRASPVMQNERWSPLKSITCTGRHLPDLGELCKSSSLLSLHQPESRTPAPEIVLDQLKEP